MMDVKDTNGTDTMTVAPLVLLAPHGLMMIGVALGIGAVGGATFGAAVGMGRIVIPHLGFLDAGSAGEAAVLFGALGAAVASLIVGVVHNHSSDAQPTAAFSAPASYAMSAHRASWLKQLPSFGALLAAAFMLYTLYVIAAHGLGAGAPSSQQNRITWDEKNVTRVGGLTDSMTAPAAWAAADPAWGGVGEPPGAIHVAHDWRLALAETPLIAVPIRATVIPDGKGVSSQSDPATVASGVDAQLRRTSQQIVIVAEDGDPRWALPAAAYAARRGTPILFVTQTSIPTPTREALAARSGKAAMLLLAPANVVGDSVAHALTQFGHVERVTGDNTADAAVQFAEFRDQARDLGWGQTGRGRQRFVSHASLIVNPSQWEDAIAAAHLARRGKSGPLLYAGSDELPASTDAYLWRLRPAYADTPEEGPYSHVWVVGSFSQIGYPAQAEADYAQEIEQYMTLGDSAVSGFEALAIAWIILALAAALWVWDNARTRAPEIMPMMRAAWTCFTLLFGVIGAALYVRSYHMRRRMIHDLTKDSMQESTHGSMQMWERPMASMVISATVMMFGFDMLLMCLAVFAAGYVGYPIIRSTNALYWMGTSMFLMMALMYVIGLLAMMLVFHAPMTMHERGVGYWKAIRAGAGMMVATMTIESIGMMPTMWWGQMHFLPAMQMPTTDDMTMWATLLMAVVVGFVVVLPFNYLMVRRGAKQGAM